MPLDLVSVLASAVVGGGAGVLFASLKTNREESTKRKALARDQIRDACEGILTEARAYQAELGPRRSESRWTDDYFAASQILLPAHNLGRFRRALLKHRLKKVVGPVAFKLASTIPAKTVREATNYAVVAVIAEAGNDVPLGMLDEALMKPRRPKKVDKVVRILKRVSGTRIL